AAGSGSAGFSARPPLRPLVASSVQPPPTPASAGGAGARPSPPGDASDRPARPIREAAAFGLRTFVDCLEADSPAKGFHIAFHALEAHRKQKEKEAEALHKARQKTAKADSHPANRTRRAANGCYYLPF